MSLFAHVKMAPSDPILGLTAAYQKDPRKNKINLIAGVYKTEELTTPVLSCVKKAEEMILASELSKNYLPIEGDARYLQSACSLVLGKKLYEMHHPLLSAVQTIGGAGALRLGGELIRQEISDRIYIPDPSWPNHRGIFSQCRLHVDHYPYYQASNKGIDFELLREYLSSLQRQSVILLHACCHNPSGHDLTKEQWRVLAKLCKEKQLIPFFDAAYLGFDVGFEEDCFPIRHFMEEEIESFLAVSFSKNLSLYAERVGFLMVYSKKAPEVFSQLLVLARRNYSNPPLHGASILSLLLQKKDLQELWMQELFLMRERIQNNRKRFVSLLSYANKSYDCLLHQKGLFAFLGLQEEQVQSLIQTHAIYMPSDGRMNLAGLTQENMARVVAAIVDVERGL